MKVLNYGHFTSEILYKMRDVGRIKMTRRFSKVAVKYVYLVFLSLIIITCINLELELLSNPLLRMLTTWTFIMLTLALMIKKEVSPTPFIALLLLATSDIFLVNWELGYAKPMYYAIHSLASIVIFFSIDWKAKNLAFSKFDLFYILTITIILSWVMINLGQYFSEEINDPLLQVLFYINSFISVILAISAFLFSANSTDNYTSYFLLAIVGLAISDLCVFMIYVMDFLNLRYLDNFMSILGCALLVIYMIKKQSIQKEEARLNFENTQEELEDHSLDPAEELKTYF